MSNFSIFSKEYIGTLLERFAPGMAEHVTPIKYEALTPDLFLFLFRTTAQNGQYHFFVSLEADHISDLEGAKCTIEDWHGKVVAFWPPKGGQPTDDTALDINEYCIPTAGPYKAILAEVERPTHKGYWAEAVVIMPGDNIHEKIKHFTDKEQINIRKTLASILQHKADPKASFIDSFQSRQQNTMTNDINQTDMAVSLYVQPDGKVECFYSHVDLTIGGKKQIKRKIT